MSTFCRYQLFIEYDGGNLQGWQRQNDPKRGALPTVQSYLELAILKATGQTVTVEGAGRTDAGVHALEQVAHFDLRQPAIAAHKIADALNFYLRNKGISVLNAQQVPSHFHARFSALSRVYQYHIINRRAALAIDHNRAWQVIPPLDLAAMQDAANLLVGAYDFSAFRAAECQAKNPHKTLTRFDLIESGGRIIATIQSRSFLHHQVRIMMGTLKLIGEGKWNRGDLIRIRDSLQRRHAGPTAPPHGLYLSKIHYCFKDYEAIS